MEEISKTVVNCLSNGEDCSKAWEVGYLMASEMGYSDNLMEEAGTRKFLGHSVGLELDETPVVAKGFDRLLSLEERWQLNQK